MKQSNKKRQLCALSDYKEKILYLQINMNKIQKHTVLVLMLSILCLDVFTDYEILIYLLCTLLVVISFFRYLKHKKQIKESVLYVRQKSPKYELLIGFGIILFIIIIVFFVDFPNKNKINSMIPITFVIDMLLGYSSIDFLGSIRQFKKGVQLPKQEIITNWNAIDEIAFDNEKLLIIISGEKYQYIVSETDIDDANKLIENFKINKKLCIPCN